MVDAVLNRASLVPPYESDHSAAVDIVAMLRGLACLERPLLRCHDNPWLIPVVTTNDGDISFGEVVYGLYGGDDHDVAAFFDAVQRMAPSDSGLGDDILQQLLDLDGDNLNPAPGLEEAFDSVQTAGMDAIQCAVTDAVLVSLGQNDMWRFDRMGFVASDLPILSFDHVATLAHGERVAQRRREELTAVNFWESKEVHFPRLLFGLDVEDYIRSFPSGWLSLAFKRLAKLNELSEKYADRQILLSSDEKRINGISPESKATMQQFGDFRRFRGADGVMNTFEEHVRVGRGNRIHIFIHEKIIEVGYLGTHLPTVNDPH